jgi:hypothetical protein
MPIMFAYKHVWEYNYPNYNIAFDGIAKYCFFTHHCGIYYVFFTINVHHIIHTESQLDGDHRVIGGVGCDLNLCAHPHLIGCSRKLHS